MNWAERSRQAVWHPCTQMKVHEQFPPRAIVSAEGPWLIDDQGHRILDAVSSWWVNLFGHNFAPIREAITDQLGRLDHIMLAGSDPPAGGGAVRTIGAPHGPGPCLLRQRWRQCHRDRPEDERPQLAQPGPGGQAPLHRPARRVPRRDGRGPGCDRHPLVSRVVCAAAAPEHHAAVARPAPCPARRERGRSPAALHRRAGRSSGRTSRHHRRADPGAAGAGRRGHGHVLARLPGGGAPVVRPVPGALDCRRDRRGLWPHGHDVRAPAGAPSPMARASSPISSA